MQLDVRLEASQWPAALRRGDDLGARADIWHIPAGCHRRVCCVLRVISLRHQGCDEGYSVSRATDGASYERPLIITSMGRRWREATVGVSIGVLSALWMSWDIHGRELSARRPWSRTDGFHTYIPRAVTRRSTRSYAVPDSLFASCAPLQACERVVAGPVRTRLLGPAPRSAQSAPKSWRRRYSLQAMRDHILERQCDQVSRGSQRRADSPCAAVRTDRPPQRQKVQCGSADDSTPFARRVRMAAGDKDVVVASLIDADRAQALSQLKVHVDFVITLDEGARQAACKAGLQFIEFEVPSPSSVPPKYMQARALRDDLVVKGTGGAGYDLVPAHSTKQAQARAALDVAKWQVVSVLSRSPATAFVVFDASVFFIGSPRDLLEIAASDVREPPLVVALRTGIDVRNLPLRARWHQPPVSRIRPTDSVIAFVRGCRSAKVGDIAEVMMRNDELEMYFNQSEVAAFDAETVVSQEHPIVFVGTVAVHVRGGDDAFPGPVLNGNRGGGEGTIPFSSIVRIAQELRLWRYSEDDVLSGRKFLAVEDYTMATLPPDFHSGEKLLSALLTLVALAYFTGRDLVMPVSLHFEKHYYSWEWLDVEHAMEQLGVVFRASSFLHDLTNFTEAKIALTAEGSVGVAANAQTRWYSADADARITTALNNPDGQLRKRLLFAVANEDDLVNQADVLYVDIDAPTNLNTLVFPERICFTKFISNGRCTSYRRVERWLAELHEMLRFCTWEARHLRALNLIAASDDCTAKRHEDVRRYIAASQSSASRPLPEYTH